MRNESERWLDAVLLLHFLRHSRSTHSRVKLQKTVFLVEFKLKQNALVGSHFRFFRYLDGPYSQQVNEDLEELARGGFIARSTLSITKRGYFLLDLIIPPLRDLPANRRTFEVIDKVLQWCKPRNSEAILRHVCGLEVSPDEAPERRMKMREIPRFWDIINPAGTALEVPLQLRDLISSEIGVSASELRNAKRKLPAIERRMFKNLAAARQSGDQPCAQTPPG